MKLMIDWKARRSEWQKQGDDTRSDYEIDYSRIVHSASFRRLQGKTQVFSLGDSDFYRTRLTHSMEVAQIGVSILKQLRNKYAESEINEHLPPSELIFSLGLAHDLGHPPFGHGGEVALNYCMREFGGFEGNGQSLRIATKLEKFSENDGFDFTRRTLLGILKYPVPYSEVNNGLVLPVAKGAEGKITVLDIERCKPPKCYLDTERPIVEFVLTGLSDSDKSEFTSFVQREEKHAKPNHKSLDCSIMELADDISYGVHDLEDAISMNLIRDVDVRSAIEGPAAACLFDSLSRRYPTEGWDENGMDRFITRLMQGEQDRKRMISRLVHFFVSSVEVSEVGSISEPLMRLRAILPEDVATVLTALKQTVRENVVFSPQVQHLEFKGQQMVVAVFEAFSEYPERFLPVSTRHKWEAAGDKREKMRVICDHISGMTDEYLLKVFERLFSPRIGSLFDRV